MLSPSRIAALVVLVSTLSACPDQEQDLNSTPLDQPTHEFEELVPNVDTDWPIDREPDTETETETETDTETDTGT